MHLPVCSMQLVELSFSIKYYHPLSQIWKMAGCCRMFGEIVYYAGEKKNTIAPDVDQGCYRETVCDKALRRVYC